MIDFGVVSLILVIIALTVTILITIVFSNKISNLRDDANNGIASAKTEVAKSADELYKTELEQEKILNTLDKRVNNNIVFQETSFQRSGQMVTDLSDSVTRLRASTESGMVALEGRTNCNLGALRTQVNDAMTAYDRKFSSNINLWGMGVSNMIAEGDTRMSSNIAGLQTSVYGTVRALEDSVGSNLNTFSSTINGKLSAYDDKFGMTVSNLERNVASQMVLQNSSNVTLMASTQNAIANSLASTESRITTQVGSLRSDLETTNTRVGLFETQTNSNITTMQSSFSTLNSNVTSSISGLQGLYNTFTNSINSGLDLIRASQATTSNQLSAGLVSLSNLAAKVNGVNFTSTNIYGTNLYSADGLFVGPSNDSRYVLRSDPVTKQLSLGANAGNTANRLNINTNIVATNNMTVQGVSTVTGNANVSGALNAGSATVNGGLSAVNASVSGALNAGNATIGNVTKTSRLQLGDKFMLSGVGDAHGNDGWLRLFHANGSGYHGGFAAGQLWSGNDVYVGGMNPNGRLCIGGTCITQAQLAKIKSRTGA